MLQITWNSVSGHEFDTFAKAMEVAEARRSYYSDLQSLYDYRVIPAAKEVISYTEFCTNVLRVYKVIREWACYGEYSMSAIALNIVGWANEKYPIITKIRNAEGYDPANPYKLVASVNAERVTDEGPINTYIDSLGSWHVCAENNIPKKIAWYDNKRKYAVLGNCNADDYYGQSVTIYTAVHSTDANGNDTSTYRVKTYPKASKYFGDTYINTWLRNVIQIFSGNKVLAEDAETYTKEWLTDDNYYFSCANAEFREKARLCKPHVGAKVSRFIRNLVQTTLGFVEDKEFGDYADNINPVIFKRTYVLSCDPVDYVLMSHGTGWESCHWINKEEATAGGCNAGGVWSYMNDGVSLVGYTVESDITKDYEIVEKVTRQMVFTNGKDVLVTTRVYPQNNDHDSQRAVTYREHRQYAQEMVSRIFGMGNYWKSKKVSEMSNRYHAISTGEGACQYEDYFSFAGLTTVSVAKEFIGEMDVNDYFDNTKPMEIGGKAYCPICGEEMGYGVTTFTCCNNYICAECGCMIDEDDVVEYNGSYYCHDCCFYDDYQDEWIPESEEEAVTVYSEWGSSYTTSESNLDTLQWDGTVFEDYMTHDYYTESSLYKEISDGYDTYKFTEASFERAVRNGTLVECAECGEYVFKVDAEYINGNYYCTDCADSLRENDDDDEAVG